MIDVPVKFCPKCENLLQKKKIDGEYYLACDCGYKEPYVPEKRKRRRLTDRERKLRGMATKTIVIEADDSPQNPTTRVECPKCHYKEAEYFQLQTRSADEPMTTFYKCLKCKHVWREY